MFDGRGVLYVMNKNAKLVLLMDFTPREGSNNSVLTATATEVADPGAVGR